VSAGGADLSGLCGLAGSVGLRAAAGRRRAVRTIDMTAAVGALHAGRAIVAAPRSVLERVAERAHGFLLGANAALSLLLAQSPVTCINQFNGLHEAHYAN
jgi:hypothetical protein